MNSLFPCMLGEDTQKKLASLSDELVKSWGDKTLTILELDDRIATAAEKAPTEDKLIKALRDVLTEVKKEYEKVLINEEENVRNAFVVEGSESGLLLAGLSSLSLLAGLAGLQLLADLAAQQQPSASIATLRAALMLRSSC